MTDRAFPLLVSPQVSATAAFYERLGFARQVQNPPTGEPSFIGLRRAGHELGIVDVAWPRDQFGGAPGTGTRYEMFVFVDDVDAVLDTLRRDGVPVLRDAVTMPWGERIAHVADPDGNAVALATAVARG
jgi:lactoylglutathione lyase